MENNCPQETKKKMIEETLKGHSTCALGTCGEDGPRVTPIEYRFVDWHLYFLSERGKKFANLAGDDRVSVAIFESYGGFENLMGLQMTGTARVIPFEDEEYDTGIAAWGLDRSKIEKLPTALHLIRVDLTRIEALMSEFKKQGYDSRQILEIGEAAR
jgi:nitroimidazol reductase NimA-like FMN-containing flavoprotein (pyridoxamine 5'-phosphate oxidase superfamily)